MARALLVGHRLCFAWPGVAGAELSALGAFDACLRHELLRFALVGAKLCASRAFDTSQESHLNRLLFVDLWLSLTRPPGPGAGFRDAWLHHVVARAYSN